MIVGDQKIKRHVTHIKLAIVSTYSYHPEDIMTN